MVKEKGHEHRSGDRTQYPWVADGGTRTASITGGAVALHDACSGLVSHGLLSFNPMRQLVAATSVGIIGGEVRLDLDYLEDVGAEVDMNLVALESGDLVEVQGTAEHGSFSTAQLDTLVQLGLDGIRRLHAAQRQTLGALEQPQRGSAANPARMARPRVSA